VSTSYKAKRESRSKAAPCPICGEAAQAQHKPFCSRRCADVDLHRWLTGSYAIPGRPAGDEDA